MTRMTTAAKRMKNPDQMPTPELKAFVVFTCPCSTKNAISRPIRTSASINIKAAMILENIYGQFEFQRISTGGID
jgi:hypothetical protein